MSLYALGDPHLAIGKNKPMDIFGDAWKNHTEKLEKGFSKLNDDDVTVLCGDISWGMGLSDCIEDFRFINSLPGKKIILKGNHDYWWTTATKAYKFFRENGLDKLDVLYNNSYTYENIAICGTRGWFYEEEKNGQHDLKVMKREIMRLEASLKTAGELDKIVFLHYPPVYLKYECPEILQLFINYNIRLCCYGHLHGRSCTNALNGWYNGTEYKLVSADHINFEPIKIM